MSYSYLCNYAFSIAIWDWMSLETCCICLFDLLFGSVHISRAKLEIESPFECRYDAYVLLMLQCMDFSAISEERNQD